MDVLSSIVFLLAALICYYFHYLLPMTLCIAILALSMISSRSNKQNLPPGPIGLPFLGNLPMMLLMVPTEYCMDLSKRFGSIYTVKLGQAINIVLNDYETIKEFSNLPDFQGRPKEGANSETFKGSGIIDAEGKTWKHQRRFVLHNLKDFGMGRLHLQDKIIDEYQHAVAEMKKSKGKPISMDIILQKTTCNIIFNLAFNKRFDYDNPDYIQRLERLNNHMDYLQQTFIVSFLPKLRIFIQRAIGKMITNFNIFRSQADVFIKEHKEVFDENDPKDLIDLFLIEVKKSVSEENEEYLSTFSEKQLQSVIVDLFIAGTETTSTTVRWAIVYLLHHPEIQEKIQAEIDNAVGHERPISMEDKPNLPFTVATLQEAERLGSILPFGIPRSNSRAAEFKGYKFPPRCSFNLNLYAVHRDPKLWKNPRKFDPKRFLDSNGKVFRPPYLIPFGVGKRYCAGESLARMETFLLFATLLQHFKFTPAGDKLPNFESKSGVFRSPSSFSVCAKPRF